MKAFISDFNNVLLELRNRVDTVRDVRSADIIILWQDVRGSQKEIATLNKLYMNKHLIVVQHGRGATRDYLPPNSFELIADRICVWGPAEAERLYKAKIDKERVVVTGSPLLNVLKQYPRKPQSENVIVFCPVITSHEEPDNIQTYMELKKIEYSKVQELLDEKKSILKESWHAWAMDENCATEHQIPYDLLRKNFFLVSKLTDIHDKELYFGPYVKTSPINKSHIIDGIKLLSASSCVVGMEEGTYQLMASYYGIPTVIVDNFQYGTYGGVQNYSTESIHTDATAFCNLSSLRETIENELAHPEIRAEARLNVVREELGDPDSDPVENIIEVACQLVGGDIRKKELVNAC